ncbi:MAG: MXAN_5187 C-terminal domain-containing protein [Myxococcota bacterium]
MATRDLKLFGGTRDLSKKPEPDLAPEIERLEKDLDALKATYELFFMGIEKLEPSVQHDALKKRLRAIQERAVRNTGLKFRRQQLKAKFVTLQNHWNRVLREREAGTYRRDIVRAERRAELLAERERLRAQQDPPTELRKASSPEGVDVPTPGTQSALPRVGQAPQGRDVSRPRASRPEDLTDAHLQRLYQTYVGARRRCGESANLGYDDMASALRKQVPKLMKQTGAKSVEFKVVIRSGKAVLKALPRHED